MFDSQDFCFWVGLAFISIGYGLSVIRAFEEKDMWGWWCIAFPPINFWYAYIILCLDRKPFFFHVAGLSIWIIGYFIYLVTPTAHAAPWHGFELAA